MLAPIRSMLAPISARRSRGGDYMSEDDFVPGVDPDIDADIEADVVAEANAAAAAQAAILDEEEDSSFTKVDATVADAGDLGQFRVVFYPSQVAVVVHAVSSDRAVSEARAELRRISEGEAVATAL
jgi:hypothetical protein